MDHTVLIAITPMTAFTS